MKAVSLWEPWATLIALGIKHFETRSWEVSYRGPLAICTVKAVPKDERAAVNEFIRKGPFVDELAAAGITSLAKAEKRGARVVAICTLDSCRPADIVRQSIDVRERLAGDYKAGRWAWRLGNVQALDGFYPVAGSQKIWELPKDVELAIFAEIAAGNPAIASATANP
jgi:hypothetical protein